MPEHRQVEMRRRGSQAQKNKQRLILAASVGGAIVVVVAIGALIVATFPKTPAVTNTASTTASAPAPSVADTPATTPATSSAKSKKHGSKAANSTPAAPPLGMARTLPGSTQMIVATAPNLGATEGKLRVYNLTNHAWKRVFSTPCRFGVKGLVDGTKRKEGNPATPTGIWSIGSFVWGWHPMPPSGTLMPYRQTTKNIWWSKESGSTYNTWVDSAQRVNGEHLIDARVQYEYALSVGYNALPNQVIDGRGTAVFLHVSDPPDYRTGPSDGCVTVSRASMIHVLTALDPSRKPSFAVGTDASGTATSIATY